MAGLKKNLDILRAILEKVGSAKWGLENRVLTITAHALLDSPIGYGLTVTGTATPEEELRKLGAQILNPTARRATGTGYSIRREVLYTPADLRSTQNRCLRKVAEVFDRTLGAGGTQAQRRLSTFLAKKGHNRGLRETETGITQLHDGLTDETAADLGNEPH